MDNEAWTTNEQSTIEAVSEVRDNTKGQTQQVKYLADQFLAPFVLPTYMGASRDYSKARALNIELRPGHRQERVSIHN